MPNRKYPKNDIRAATQTDIGCHRSSDGASCCERVLSASGSGSDSGLGHSRTRLHFVWKTARRARKVFVKAGLSGVNTAAAIRSAKP